MVPVPQRAVQAGEVEGGDDLVGHGEAMHAVPDLDDVACHVGAGDDVVFDREGVLGGADGDVAEVESDAADFDDDLVFGGLRDGFAGFCDSVEAVAVFELEGKLLVRHVGL